MFAYVTTLDHSLLTQAKWKSIFLWHRDGYSQSSAFGVEAFQRCQRLFLSTWLLFSIWKFGISKTVVPHNISFILLLLLFLFAFFSTLNCPFCVTSPAQLVSFLFSFEWNNEIEAQEINKSLSWISQFMLFDDGFLIETTTFARPENGLSYSIGWLWNGHKTCDADNYHIQYVDAELWANNQ